MPFELHDAVTLGDTRVTKAGYLVADARIARTGIQVYQGREVGRPDLDRVRVYRGEDEVFAGDSLASYAYVPVTDDHPPVMVDAANWKKFARGQAGGEILRDGQFIKMSLMVSDAATIKQVQDGKRELSAGYVCDLDWTAGTAPDGETYDCRMTSIRGNHIAVVQRGRAGSACRIGDDDPNNDKENEPMAILMIDGKPVEMPDTAIAHISKLETALSGATTRITAKDGEIDAMKASHAAELAAANAKILDGAALDAAIAARTTLLASAKVILGDKFVATGKSDDEIRKAAVAVKLGDAKVADKDAAYITAAFDVLCATPAPKGKDPIADALAANAPVTDSVSAYDEYVASLRDAHRNEKKDA